MENLPKNVKELFTKSSNLEMPDVMGPLSSKFTIHKKNIKDLKFSVTRTSQSYSYT